MFRLARKLDMSFEKRIHVGMTLLLLDTMTGRKQKTREE